MKDITNKEFKYCAERDCTGGALSAVEWCLEKFLEDDEIDINDTYACDRGIEELISALWMARKSLRRYKDYEEDEDDRDEFMEDNFSCSGAHLIRTKEITKESVLDALREIQKKYPESGTNGLTEDLGLGKPVDCIDDGDFLEEVKTAANYIQQVIKVAGLRSSVTKKGQTSYGLKHSAERWGRKNGMSPYVCNMAAIVAMWLHPLVKIKVIDNYPNPRSNLPQYFNEENLSS